MNNYNKVKEMLEAGSESSTKMALKLIKGQNMEFNFTPYEKLAKWIGATDEDYLLKIMNKWLSISDEKICGIPQIDHLFSNTHITFVNCTFNDITIHDITKFILQFPKLTNFDLHFCVVPFDPMTLSLWLDKREFNSYFTGNYYDAKNNLS